MNRAGKCGRILLGDVTGRHCAGDALTTVEVIQAERGHHWVENPDTNWHGIEWDYTRWRPGAYDPTPPPLHNRGDVTEDSFVGADDLVAILTHWGETGDVPWENGDIAPYGDGSNPGDDFVGADDYVEVLTYWGASYDGPIPEPATLLLLLGGLAMLRRRK